MMTYISEGDYHRSVFPATFFSTREEDISVASTQSLVCVSVLSPSRRYYSITVLFNDLQLFLLIVG